MRRSVLPRAADEAVFGALVLLQRGDPELEGPSQDSCHRQRAIRAICAVMTGNHVTGSGRQTGVRRGVSAVLLASLVLGACGDDEGVTGTGDTVAVPTESLSDQPLIGTRWTVIGFVHGEASELVDAPGESPAAVRFEENGFVSWSDGCNGFGYVVDETATDAERAELGVVYEVDGNWISFAGSAVSTERGCLGEDHESYGQAVRAALRGRVTSLTPQITDHLTTASGRITASRTGAPRLCPAQPSRCHRPRQARTGRISACFPSSQQPPGARCRARGTGGSGADRPRSRSSHR